MEEFGLDLGGMISGGLEMASGFESVTEFTSQLDISGLQEGMSNISDFLDSSGLDRFTRRTNPLNIVRQLGRQGRVLSPPPQTISMNPAQIQTVLPAPALISGPSPIQLSPGVPIQTMTQSVVPLQVRTGVPVQTVIQVPSPVPMPPAPPCPAPLQPGVPQQTMIQQPAPAQIQSEVPQQTVIQEPALAPSQPGVPQQTMIQEPAPAQIQPGGVPPQTEGIQGSSPPQGPPMAPIVQTVAVQPTQAAIQMAPTVQQVIQPAAGIQQGQMVQGPQAIYQPNQTVIVSQPQGTVVTSAGTRTKPPDAHTCLAWTAFIISWFACCWPFGLISVKFSQRAVLANRHRKYHKAESAGRQAKTFAIVAIVLTCITFTILIVVLIIGGITSSNSGSSYSSNDSSYNY